MTRNILFDNIREYAKWLEALGYNTDADNLRRSSTLFLYRRDKTMLERTLKTAEQIYGSAQNAKA